MTELEEIQELKNKIHYLEDKIAKYEGNGMAKLYFSLNRKANEMADLLNNTNLTTISLDDPKDKTFDRLKVIWNDSSSLTEAIKSLEQSAGITGDESKDTQPRQRITPESIAGNIGNTAGSIKQ